MSLSNVINLIIDSVYSKDVGVSEYSAKISEALSSSISGADIIHISSGVISGGSNDIDLVGSLKTPLGDDAIFAKVMAIYFKNTGDNVMTIGGANNIPLLADDTDKLNLASNAKFFYLDEAGIVIDSGTGDLITIAGTNGDTYEIIIIGS